MRRHSDWRPSLSRSYSISQPPELCIKRSESVAPGRNPSALVVSQTNLSQRTFCSLTSVLNGNPQRGAGWIDPYSHGVSTTIVTLADRQTAEWLIRETLQA